MTDFKTISGRKIKFLTSDLTMSTATEGELFYSATDNEFKVGVSVLAWSAGGNLNGPRDSLTIKQTKDGFDEQSIYQMPGLRRWALCNAA